jgi:hypothetical protein
MYQYDCKSGLNFPNKLGGSVSYRISTKSMKQYMRHLENSVCVKEAVLWIIMAEDGNCPTSFVGSLQYRILILVERFLECREE